MFTRKKKIFHTLEKEKQYIRNNIIGWDPNALKQKKEVYLKPDKM